jgi:hypothetical protein
MSFGLSSSDLLGYRRLQTVVCASNVVGPSNIYQGAPGPPGPTGSPGPVNYMNGGYEYLYSPFSGVLPNGSFSFTSGNDLLGADQIQISMLSENGTYLSDYFFQIPCGSRLILYNKINSITHTFIIKSQIRYSGLYIFEVSLTTPISYVPVINEGYIISFLIRGPPGEGIPGGGNPGEVLVKQSCDEFDAKWSLSLPYLARGRIPNTADTAYTILDSSKKWVGSNNICMLNGSDMSNLTISGDPSIFLRGTFTGQQQWTMSYNSINVNNTSTYTISPPSYIGKANSNGITPFHIVSAGTSVPVLGSGTSWILWNL